jgi:hypothetical protein
MKIPKSFDPWYTNGRNLGVPIAVADGYLAAGATAALTGRTITLTMPSGATFVATAHHMARRKTASWVNGFNARALTRSDQLCTDRTCGQGAMPHTK